MVNIGYIEKKLNSMGREILSTGDIACILGIDPSTIRRHIRSNKLKAIKIGGVYHIRIKEAADYLREYSIY